MLINSFFVMIIILYQNQHISYGFHMHHIPKVFQLMPINNNYNINRKDVLTQSQLIVQAISSSSLSTTSSTFTSSSISSTSLQSTSSVMKTSSSREINRLKNRDFEKNLKLGVLFLNLGGPERMEVSFCCIHNYHCYAYHQDYHHHNHIKNNRVYHHHHHYSYR